MISAVCVSFLEGKLQLQLNTTPFVWLAVLYLLFPMHIAQRHPCFRERPGRWCAILELRLPLSTVAFSVVSLLAAWRVVCPCQVCAVLVVQGKLFPYSQDICCWCGQPTVYKKQRTSSSAPAPSVPALERMLVPSWTCGEWSAERVCKSLAISGCF